MFGLSQLLNKKGRRIILLGIFAFLALGFAQGAELGVSPSEIVLAGETGEEICTTITLLSSHVPFSLQVQDRWSVEDVRDLHSYILAPSFVDIDTTYVPFITLNSQRSTYSYCVRSARAGKYFGVLIFSATTSAVGVGSWIRVDITQKVVDYAQQVGPREDFFKVGWALLSQTAASITLLLLLIRKIPFERSY